MNVETYEGIEQVEAEIVPVTTAALAVIDQCSRDHAVEFLKEIKSTANRVKDYWAPLKKQASDAHKAIVAREKEMLEPLESKEREVKSLVLDFDREQERIRRAEQERLQREADEAARRERERLEKKAAQVKTEAAKEKYAEQAAAVVAPTVTVAPQVERQKGEATVKRWKARLVNINALIDAAANGNPLAIGMLEFNQTAANKQATATKDGVQIPGIEFYAEETLSVRSGR